MNREIAWDMHVMEVASLHLSAGPTAEAVPNGSFESGAGDAPDGWHLAAGALGASTEWLASGGVDDGRCLRISPRGGGASWYCDPILIVGGAEYLFRCTMKRDGNRHWAHACAASWVSLVFLDAALRPCRQDPENDQPLALVRCRKTDDWVEATRYLVAPKEACYLLIGFRITRGEPDVSDAYGFRKFWHGDIDTGDWWVDNVRLDRVPLDVAAPKGRLSVRVPEGGARLRVVNEAGETFAPPGAVTYTEGGGCFHAMRPSAELLLPPGRYNVEAMRGFQRKPFRAPVEVTEGQTVSTQVALPRVVDWPSQGWYAGDHHDHLSFHGATRHPMLSIDDMYRIARGEGLDYLSFCGEMVDQHSYADWRDAGRPSAAKPDGAFGAPDFVCSVSHEVTQDLLGHVCLVNAPGHVAPGHPWWLRPTNAEIFDAVSRGDAAGTVGAVVMAHPFDGLTPENLWDVLADPAVTGLQRELPVDVALGLAHTMDLLAVESRPDLDFRCRDYFRLLNLGFRLGVSGASDAYADQGTEIVGGLRTIVHADAFTMDAVAAAYRGGRTMATNGPLLTFCVNGACPGDRVSGPDLRVEAQAYSNWGLTRLDIVANGEVVAEASPGDDGWVRLAREIPCEQSGWLLARAWGPAHPALNAYPVAEAQRSARGQCCVTSPIYVDVSGKPIVPRAADAAYFARWIDVSCEAIRSRKAFLEGKGPYPPDLRDEDVDNALALFGRAREIYQAML